MFISGVDVYLALHQPQVSSTAVTHSVYDHWHTDDETAVILQAWAVSVTTAQQGCWPGGMPKPSSTYSRSGNVVETTLAETETRQKVVLEAVSAPKP